MKNDLEHPKKAAFIAAYSICGSIAAACRAAQIGRTSHYRWLNEDEVYREQFEHANDDAVDSLEAEARRRAVEGWDEPIFSKGVQVEVKRRYSDTLLIFLLNGAQPEKYRQGVIDTKAKGEKLTIVEVDDWYGTSTAALEEEAASPERSRAIAEIESDLLP